MLEDGKSSPLDGVNSDSRTSSLVLLFGILCSRESIKLIDRTDKHASRLSKERPEMETRGFRGNRLQDRQALDQLIADRKSI